MIPPRVRAFRENYREHRIPWFYYGEIHVAFTAAVLLGTIGWHLSRLRAATWAELLTVPATLILGNWVEYTIHRYPLHRVYKVFEPGYRIHTLQHHSFYVSGAMDFESFRDFMMVLFPPWAPVGAGLVTSLIGAYVLAPLVSANAGHLFAAAGTGSLLLYELLHSLSHCADDSWAGRLPLIQGIRRHHRGHHDPVLMSRYNFNITFPLFDWVYGTTAPLLRPEKRRVLDVQDQVSR